MLQGGCDSSITTEWQQQLLSALPCGVCVARQDGRLSFVFANDSFYRMFGYPDAEAAISDSKACLHDCMDAAAIQTIEQQLNKPALNDEQPAAFEVRLRHKDGGFIWSMMRMRRIETEEKLLYCAFMDISAQKRVEEELRVREEEYRIAIRQSDKFVFRYDIEKRVASFPQESAELFQMETLTDLPGSLESLGMVNPDSREAFHEFYDQICSGSRPTGSAVMQLRLGGADRPFEWYRVAYSLIYREDHSPAQAVISLENVSEQHMREVAYQRWEQTYEAMPQKNTAYLEFDLTQNRLEAQKGELVEALPVTCNNSMESALRYFIDRYVHSDDQERIRAFIAREHLLTEYFRGAKLIKPEYRHRRAGEKYGWVRLSVQMLPDPYSSNIRASLLLRDIDAQKREEITLKDLLRTDALTGALNRSAFVEAVEALFSDARGACQHALVMVDVDHFKQINDRFGHTYGDRVLIRVCNALRTALRTDDLVARIGGDEFVLLLRNIQNHTALQNKINSLCEQLCQRVSSDTVVSCSFGAAACPRDGSSFDELYTKADAALYAAKESGRNCARLYENEMGRTMTLFNNTDIG